MAKELHIGILLDYYKQLLTQKQAECIDLYYNQDLSLYEISQLLDISRQGVRDNIKRGEKQLLMYEEMLSLAAGYEEIEQYLDKIDKTLSTSKDKAAAQEIAAYTEQIRKVIS